MLIPFISAAVVALILICAFLCFEPQLLRIGIDGDIASLLIPFIAVATLVGVTYYSHRKACYNNEIVETESVTTSAQILKINEAWADKYNSYISVTVEIDGKEEEQTFKNENVQFLSLNKPFETRQVIGKKRSGEVVISYPDLSKDACTATIKTLNGENSSPTSTTEK